MNAKEFNKYLRSAGISREAIKWSKGMSLSQAWAHCLRGDWMLDLIRNSGCYDLKTITKIKVKCARLVQHSMTDKRSLDALDVADKFALGNATLTEFKKAAHVAHAAHVCAYNASIPDAYAARAAYAVFVASPDHVVKAAAGYPAYFDAAVYASPAAASKILQQCADICREIIPQIKIKTTKL